MLATPTQVIQIVPNLPPFTDGIGDYALKLAEQLQQDWQLRSHFLVGNPSWVPGNAGLSFPSQAVAARSSSALHRALNQLSLQLTNQLPDQPQIRVLLHCSGYGYAKRGWPLWLWQGLKAWKQTAKHHRLLTLFHEIYAVGPPWRSSFWYSLPQKDLAVKLIRLSDRCLTTKQSYADTLRVLSHQPKMAVPTLPVFSTIGEPTQLPNLENRPRRLVIFGQPANRQRVYQQSLTQLIQICESLNIEELEDIGPPLASPLPTIPGVRIVALGKQPVDQVSDRLSHAVGGLMNYAVDFLAKSTIFAAYCAHGVIPIVTLDPRQHLAHQYGDGLEAGKHYWLAQEGGTTQLNWPLGAAIAQHAHEWYQTHTLAVQAHKFVEILCQREQ